MLQTIDLFKKGNFSYIVNIKKDNEILIQLIHGGINKYIHTNSKDFNYSISLNFYEENERFQSFEKLSLSKEFIYYEYQKIPSYILNCKNDKIKTKKYLIEIILKVYECNVSDYFEFEIHQEAPIERIVPS